MQTTEQHIDAFWTPRGLTAYATREDLDIIHGPQYKRIIIMLDDERADRFSYGPSLTTMVDYVTAEVHRETVAQALAVRS